jgi:peroxiredoxin
MIANLSLPVKAQQDLTFLSPDGQSVTLSSLKGKVVVLAFSGVQDPQCRELTKALQSLSERYQGKDVSINWVSVNSAAEASNEKLKAPCGPVGAISVLRDQNQAAFKRFGGKQLPTLILLDKQGQPSGRPYGGFNPDSNFVNDLAASIDTLLK